jgi:hypothetical protein
MNWIQKIISKTAKNRNNQVENPEFTDGIMHSGVSEDIFIDNQPPQMETPVEAKENHITIFLQRDYVYMGRRDGYEFHAGDLLANMVRRIKTEFRLAIDREIGEKSMKLRELRDQRIDIIQVSDNLCGRVDEQIADLLQTIKRYEQEKALSADDEGWVMKAIHEYRDGFIRGYADYMRESELGHETGLFT